MEVDELAPAGAVARPILTPIAGRGDCCGQHLPFQFQKVCSALTFGLEKASSFSTSFQSKTIDPAKPRGIFKCQQQRYPARRPYDGGMDCAASRGLRSTRALRALGSRCSRQKISAAAQALDIVRPCVGKLHGLQPKLIPSRTQREGWGH